MHDAVWIELIAAIGTVIVAGFGVLGVMVQRTHRLVNSRLGELIELVRESSHAKGYAEGVKSEMDKRIDRLAGDG